MTNNKGNSDKVNHYNWFDDDVVVVFVVDVVVVVVVVVVIVVVINKLEFLIVIINISWHYSYHQQLQINNFDDK